MIKHYILSGSCLFCLLLVGCGLGSNDDSLPEDHEYQIVLKEWLNQLDESHFDIPEVKFDYPTDFKNLDNAYRNWIGFSNAIHGEAQPDSLLVDSKYFTLEAIESEQGVRCFSDAESAAWWIGLDYDGNPLQYHVGARYRCAVMAIVNMVMLDHGYEKRTLQRRSDYRADALAGNLLQWLYAYPVFEPILPNRIKDACLVGLRKQLDRMLSMAPRDVNTNIDTMEIVALALASEIWTGKVDQILFADEARRILFGDKRNFASNSDHKKGIFNKAGYIAEMDGPETSYNGVSLYHLLHAALITKGKAEWDAFIPETVERMIKFKAYQTFPDANGYYTGPSSWSKRTNASYAHDQRARRWRELASAMISEQGYYLLTDTRSKGLSIQDMLPDVNEMNEMIQAAIHAINDFFSVKPKPLIPPLFNEVAVEWPDDLNYAYNHYIEGSYSRFKTMLDQNYEQFLPPYERNGDFNLRFSDEFWVFKKNNWGFQIETVSEMGRGYDRGGSGALAGGSLTCLWSRKTGCVLLGKLPEKWDKVKWDSITSWTSNHLWGQLKKGRFFSSARNRNIEVIYDDPNQRSRVTIAGEFAVQPFVFGEFFRTDPKKGKYERVFEVEADRLKVESIAGISHNLVDSVWESFPVFLKDEKYQASLDYPNIIIQAEDGSKEISVSLYKQDRENPPVVLNSVYKNVNEIIIERMVGKCRISFDEPIEIQISSPVYTGAYQIKNHILVLHFKMRSVLSKYELKYVVSFAE